MPRGRVERASSACGRGLLADLAHEPLAVDHESLVRSLADGVEAIVGADRERQLAALYLQDGHVDRDGHPGGRRSGVRDPEAICRLGWPYPASSPAACPIRSAAFSAPRGEGLDRNTLEAWIRTTMADARQV